jgi:hypothetical protein
VGRETIKREILREDKTAWMSRVHRIWWKN